MSYAQDGEDLTVLKYFRSIGIEKGRFLDIGAADFNLISNTRLLAEKGWGGLLVEPSYRLMHLLLQEAARFPSVDILNAAVTVTGDIVPFYDPPTEPFISTLSKSLMERGHERTGSRSFFVAPISPVELYRRFGAFDFVSIDAEGMSVALLRALPLNLMKTRCICVEFFDKDVLGLEHTEGAVIAAMERADFRHLKTTKENVIGVR